MAMHNVKLPNDSELAREAASGMTIAQIALRYGATLDRVRRRLKAIDVTLCLPPKRKLDPCNIPRYVVARKVTLPSSGTTVQNISLPRVSILFSSAVDP